MARKRAAATTAAKQGGPDVIVDFEFDRGLLFICITNIGTEPAYSVRVEFDPPIVGFGGTKEISAQPLFSQLEFLPPGKSIRTLVDSSASYFSGGQPTRVATRITARNSKRARRVSTIHHDLEIYRDVHYVVD